VPVTAVAAVAAVAAVIVLVGVGVGGLVAEDGESGAIWAVPLSIAVGTVASGVEPACPFWSRSAVRVFMQSA
jgi:hypothetical protein